MIYLPLVRSRNGTLQMSGLLIRSFLAYLNCYFHVRALFLETKLMIISSNNYFIII